MVNSTRKGTQHHESPRKMQIKTTMRGFPGGAEVKNLPANAGDMGSRPGPGRSHMPQSK